MEFKGTKVFPKYEGGDNYSIDLIFNNESVISIDRRSRYSDVLVCEREEMEANALLISKAPEMLEKLQEILNYEGGDERLPNWEFEEIKELIKVATEL